MADLLVLDYTDSPTSTGFDAEKQFFAHFLTKLGLERISSSVQ